MSKVLILGANGMFGSMVASVLTQKPGYRVEQTMRPGVLAHAGCANVPTHRCDVLDTDSLMKILLEVSPDIVVNCTGLIKQRPEAGDPLVIFPINALFPHRLARLCSVIGARMIHFSTDCIFSGETGDYADGALSDVNDYYGTSKWLGEIKDQPHVLTLRTSIIGHEAHSAYQLIDWFLGQVGPVKGYTRAMFSGFPTAEVGNILAERVFPNPNLSGVFNIAAEPISKYELLLIVRDVYEKEIEIIPDGIVAINRSLNSSTFRELTGYSPPNWRELVELLQSTRPDFNKKH